MTIERAWDLLSRWAVPVMMAIAYTLLAATSDTDATGKFWMAVGLGLVMIAWFVFRTLAERAALSRALSVGDVPRLLSLAARHLHHSRRPTTRAPFLLGRALAHQLRADFPAALTTLDDLDTTQLSPDLQPLASIIRRAALLELHHPDLPPLPVTTPRTPALTWLASAQLALHTHDLPTASQHLTRVIDDIRAGSALRAIAHLYAARIATTTGDPATAAHHRTAAANLAAPDATWLRQPGDSPPNP